MIRRKLKLVAVWLLLRADRKLLELEDWIEERAATLLWQVRQEKGRE